MPSKAEFEAHMNCSVQLYIRTSSTMTLLGVSRTLRDFIRIYGYSPECQPPRRYTALLTNYWPSFSLHHALFKRGGGMEGTLRFSWRSLRRKNIYSQVSSRSWIDLYFGIWPSSIFKPNKNHPKHPYFVGTALPRNWSMALRLELRLFFRPISGEIAIKPSGRRNVNKRDSRKLWPQVFFWEKQKVDIYFFCFFLLLFRVYLGLRVLKFICYVLKMCFFKCFLIVFCFQNLLLEYALAKL